MSLATAHLVDHLRELQLLGAEQLTELAKSDLARLEPAALVQELGRRQWLTSFQGHQLLTGGDLVVGNYLLVDRIGAGAMGTVFKARHRKLGRRVALKTINPGQREGSEAVQRFLR
ncbi:MAG: serine/threonine protein kinase, partial [Gemmataceae bacterium]